MRKQANWSGRILLGSGILFSVIVIAIPQREGGRDQLALRPDPRPPEVLSSWFGHLSGDGACGFDGLGANWFLVGPLEFVEFDDDTAHLVGTFRKGRTSQTYLSVEAMLSGREASVGQYDEGPGSYRYLEGHALGSGELEGGLMRLMGDEDQALEIDGSQDYSKVGDGSQLVFRWEWVEAPNREGFWSESRQSQSFDVEFRTDAPWEVEDFSFDLGSVPGDYRWVTGGQFVERIDGTASLTAILAERSHPERAFYLELEFGDSCSTGTFSRSYGHWAGRLTGVDELSGALVELHGIREPFEVYPQIEEEGPAFLAWGEFSSHVESWPQESTLECREGATNGSLGFGLTNTTLRFAYASRPAGLGREVGESALKLGTLGDDYIFESAGIFQESSNGTAHLRGIVVRRSASDHAFQVDVELSERMSDSDLMGSPWFGLESMVYEENGGPVSRRSWHYYGQVRGKLVGLRGFEGLELLVSENQTPFQVGYGANGRSLSQGGYSSFQIETRGEAQDLSYRSPDYGQFFFDLRGVSDDSLAVAEGGAGVWLSSIGSDFFFVSGGRIRQLADGTASVTGVLQRENFSGDRFFVDLHLGDRRDSSPNWPGSGGALNGGRPDTLWAAYSKVCGTLIGLGDFHGARIAVTGLSSGLGFGPGANGVDSELGVGAHMRMEVLEQPKGERRFPMTANECGFALDVLYEESGSAEEALALPMLNIPSGHALYIPGIAEDFIFPHPGRFQEFADGTACLEGRISSTSRPGLGFELLIDFSGRYEASESSQGARQLPASAYADRGGPVDSELWHHYRKSSGILIGVDELAGAVVDLDSESGALQVGLGANGRNLEYGASGEFGLKLLSQPVRGSEFLPAFYPGGEIHIDLPATARE